MARATMHVSDRDGELWSGDADIRCGTGEFHDWEIVLRASHAEAEGFRHCRRANRYLGVDVPNVGRGRAEVVRIEDEGPGTHVHLSGLGACPFPDH